MLDPWSISGDDSVLAKSTLADVVTLFTERIRNV